MLKKIKVTQLRKGMYINDIKCGWFDHPFTLNRFKLNNDTDIRKMIAAGVKEVDIDTAKGLDVVLEKSQTAAPSVVCDIVKKSDGFLPKITVQQEMSQAKIAVAEAGEFITDMMANAKMGMRVELEQVNPVISKMSASILRNENALLGLSRLRVMDKYTFEHSVSISILMMSFAKSLGFSKQIIHEVGIGGLLHDIGKTLTPNEILNKPGKLTEQEFMIMKKHVVDGSKILQKTQGLSQIAFNVAAQHHERYDGSGYPLGLQGDQISLYGQMAAVVDVYDALTADRCYHKGKEPSEVLKLLLKWAGGHFKPELVQKFIQTVGIYPPGSLVLLNNQHLATVTELKHNMLKPEVEIFVNIEKRCYVPRKLIDLSERQDLKILSVESYAKWNIKL